MSNTEKIEQIEKRIKQLENQYICSDTLRQAEIDNEIRPLRLEYKVRCKLEADSWDGTKEHGLELLKNVIFSSKCIKIFLDKIAT